MFVGWTQMWIPFLDGRNVETGPGTMQHHSGFPYRYGCVDGVGAGLLALRFVHVVMSISTGFGGRRTPAAKMIHTGQPSAEWPGYTEGSAGDGRR